MVYEYCLATSTTSSTRTTSTNDWIILEPSGLNDRMTRRLLLVVFGLLRTSAAGPNLLRSENLLGASEFWAENNVRSPRLQVSADSGRALGGLGLFALSFVYTTCHAINVYRKDEACTWTVIFWNNASKRINKTK